MKKSTVILAIITFIAIIFYTLPAAPWNCCDMAADCCCEERNYMGDILEGYVCVCTPTGGPIIYGECYYTHPQFGSDW
jgi:hypothetical protein